MQFTKFEYILLVSSALTSLAQASPIPSAASPGVTIAASQSQWTTTESSLSTGIETSTDQVEATEKTRTASSDEEISETNASSDFSGNQLTLERKQKLMWEMNYVIVQTNITFKNVCLQSFSSSDCALIVQRGRGISELPTLQQVTDDNTTNAVNGTLEAIYKVTITTTQFVYALANATRCASCDANTDCADSNVHMTTYVYCNFMNLFTKLELLQREILKELDGHIPVVTAIIRPTIDDPTLRRETNLEILAAIIPQLEASQVLLQKL